MAAICAHRTAGVDVKPSSRTAALASQLGNWSIRNHRKPVPEAKVSAEHMLRQPRQCGLDFRQHRRLPELRHDQLALGQMSDRKARTYAGPCRAAQGSCRTSRKTCHSDRTEDFAEPVAPVSGFIQICASSSQFRARAIRSCISSSAGTRVNGCHGRLGRFRSDI